MNRRDFLLSAAAAQVAAQTAAPRFTLCFFSKHLPNLSYDDLGKTLKSAGFEVTCTRQTGTVAVKVWMTFATQ